MPSGIKNAFNRAALTYDQAAVIQHTIGNHLISCLPKKTHERIIDLGCGTGYTTQKLASHVDFQAFHAMDIATSALSVAKNTCKAHTINFIEGDFNHVIAPQHIDLIFANMAVQWANDLSLLFKRCYAALNHHGLFAFSLPLANTFHELTGFTAKRLLPTFDDVLRLLNREFSVLHHENKQYLSTHKNTLACLRAIKQTGATFVSQTPPSSLTKTRLREIQITQLTYDIGFFIGQKAC